MSRCFPYHPPRGYLNGASSNEALIESIKLQKETEKAIKAERKKEKKEKKEKEKKQKQKEMYGQKRKSETNLNELQQDSYKSLQKATELKEAHDKKTRPNTEQLEKSDLSEEHGPSINTHKPSYSSDSTQNSNKRKRDDAILPDASSGYGKPIKIRVLKKHIGPDSPMEIDPSVPLASKPSNETTVIHNRKTNGIPATYGRQNNAVSRPETKNDALQGLHFGRKQPAARVIPPTQLEPQTPSAQLNRTEVPVASRGLHSSRQPLVPSYGRPVLPGSRVDFEKPGPSSVVPPVPSVSRKIDVQGVLLDLNKTNAPFSEKRSLNELAAPVNDGPTRFEKQKDPISEVPQKVAPTRHEKKIHKKHSKYEKLIDSWVPPVLETLQVPDDDEDWLSRRVKTVKSSSRDNVEPCQELTASSLWQPCARFLVEADIHALPFTVPF